MSSREPLRVFVTQKYLIPSKIIVFLFGGFFLLELYSTLTTGVATSRGGVTFEKGEHWGYYVNVIKNAAVAVFCLWFGIFGIKLKSSADRNTIKAIKDV